MVFARFFPLQLEHEFSSDRVPHIACKIDFDTTYKYFHSAFLLQFTSTYIINFQNIRETSGSSSFLKLLSMYYIGILNTFTLL